MHRHMMDNVILGARKQRVTEEQQAIEMVALVIEEVHPSQFNVLPPSPKEIFTKACIIGVGSIVVKWDRI